MSDPSRPALQGLAMRELMIAHQFAATSLNRVLAPIALNLTHVSLLSHLAHAGRSCSVSEVAGEMQMNQPAVSKALKVLADRGAVTVHTPAEDGRRRTVEITAHGGDLLGQANLAMHPAATRSFTGLTDERLVALIDLLTEVRVNLDGVLLRSETATE